MSSYSMYGCSGTPPRHSPYPVIALTWDMVDLLCLPCHLQQSVDYLVHASSCRSVSCEASLCERMKQALWHPCNTSPGNAVCSNCKLVEVLMWQHFCQCSDDDCTIPKCQIHKLERAYALKNSNLCNEIVNNLGFCVIGVESKPMSSQ